MTDISDFMDIFYLHELKHHVYKQLRLLLKNREKNGRRSVSSVGAADGTNEEEASGNSVDFYMNMSS